MKKLIVVAFVFGLALPFIPALTVGLVFYFLVPLALFSLAALFYLIISYFHSNINRRKALFLFAIISTFFLAQILSAFTVDKVQRFRSERIIAEIENIKTRTGEIPTNYKATLGIEYNEIAGHNAYEISYSRGYLVTERYQSDKGNWKSYGWND